MLRHPKAGTDYPENFKEFLGWFRDDADCLEFLEHVRWLDGFSCPLWRVRQGLAAEPWPVDVQVLPA